MSRNWIKRIVAVVVFLISMFVIDFIMNRETSEITMDMPKATLPVVSVKVEGYKINTMYGYTSKREESFTKDNITPISSNREIALVIDTFDAKIDSISYEVRSIDGQRLIEEGEVRTLQSMPGKMQCSIVLKDLTQESREYAFVTILTLEDGEKVYYYNRFVQDDSYNEKEKLDFVMRFHNTTFEEDGTEIKKYLESNSQGDNTNFHKVDIHSSLEQVMWDLFPVEKAGEPLILIKDITKQTASIVVKYLVKESRAAKINYYFVEEYYRIKYTPDRIYLLDYERTMDEIFDADKSSFSNDKINLGITDGEVPMMENEGGRILAFINANRLFVYNSVDNKLSEVFSFYDKNNFDIRTTNRNFEIKILKMEDSGNLAFMAAGYMNRGIHEGEVGVAVYFYDTMNNTIEEQIFIPYEKSSDILMEELGNLSYLSADNHFFLILQGSLLDVNLTEKSYEVIISDLAENTYKVSESGRMIAWLKEKEPYKSRSLYWMNLNDRKNIEIKSEHNQYITVLGFIEEDLIYGFVEEEDIRVELSGKVIFPIYKLLIRNQDNKILKNYEKENCYIVDCSILNNQITLNRVEVGRDGNYNRIQDDHIASKDIKDGNVNKVNTVAIDVYKKIVQLVLKNTTQPNSLKIMTPKEVIFEGGREINIELNPLDTVYYVYGPKGVEDITMSSAEAVKQAYEMSGSVVDGSGNYVWRKGTICTKNQIMSIIGTKEDGENSSLAVCLDTILGLEGIPGKTQILLNEGKDAIRILKDSLKEERILDLRGCTLDTVLYYVDQDIPVLALMENKDAYLIVGFNEYNVVLMDPKTGKVYKKGMNDSSEMFEKNGNQFITYLR